VVDQLRIFLLGGQLLYFLVFFRYQDSRHQKVMLY